MTFTALRTERLLIRPVRPTDAEAIAARRNHPEVAEYQTWTLPYPAESADTLVAEIGAMDGPTDGEWWMATVADLDDSEVLGDLAVRLSWQGRTAELGYTMARQWWGHGYAVEAAAAMVAHLFDELGVTRIEASLHPGNQASAMVLERLGMHFEGHTASSFWVGEENSDDWLYGMTRPMWESWCDRIRTPPATVQLTEITEADLHMVLELSIHHSQEQMVAPVAVSLSEALILPGTDPSLVPWYRAVVADGEIVGFVMLARSSPGRSEPYLWRLTIDRMHQRRGIGRRVLDLIADQCRAWGDPAVTVSWLPGKGSPAPLYLGYGFAPTGEVDHGEVVGRLRLS